MQQDGDISFTLKKGEILGLYQKREPPALLLRLPVEAATIGPPGVHVHLRGQLVVSATACGPRRAGGVASPVDLTTIKRISTHALARHRRASQPVRFVGRKGTVTAPSRRPEWSQLTVES
jgi:hypothetical protein